MKKLIFVSLVLMSFILMNRPVAAWAQDTKVTGEVVDTFCYVSMGAKGAGHRSCGLECAKKGIPVGLLENSTGKLYVLLPNKNGMSLPDSVIDKMGQTATVTGRVYSEGGSQFLTVESVS
ncbi:MAG: hypothetical protein KGK03_06005 [Candidatus Omnitrophica bacterium]|nr:hypothetical protein [Candidatus Omnitrophota bacterium]MDE2222606.1 hypothetical protein [Candidatus Omnitrophota bacterium]